MRLPFRRQRKATDIAAELDRDIKGTTEVYIDGAVVADRRKERRPPSRSLGTHVEPSVDDPYPVPFVPPPEDWKEHEPPHSGGD